MRLLLLPLFLLSSFLAAVEFELYSGDIQREQPTATNHVASYAGALHQARNTVVNISTQKSVQTGGGHLSPFFNDPFFRQFFDDRRFQIPKERIERSLGSGVIISADGYIVTNNHVVEEAQSIIVSLPGSSDEYEAKLIGTDPKSDLAVIKIETTGLDPIVFFDSDQVEVGDVVFAIGNPFGVGETVTSGIVSATNRSGVGIVEYEDFIQTDAAINPGNSGGALINTTGALIGINSAILTRSGASHGIGFSIPANMVRQIATALINDGEFVRAWLGVSIGNLDEETEAFYGRRDGAVIMGVEPGSPAEAGGIKRGDLIIRINDRPIDGANTLRNVIGSYPPQTRVDVRIIRDKQERTLKVTLGSTDRSSAEVGGLLDATASYKGLSVSEPTEDQRRKLQLKPHHGGVIVTSVDPESKAAQVGFRPGDLIVQIESLEIGSLEDFTRATTSDEPRRIFLMRRGGMRMTVL
jgi:serine protease Do